MKTVIGVIGTIASGKDVVADYIAQRLDVAKYEISQPLKEIAAERDLPVTRDILIQLGRQLADDLGPDYLAKILLEKVGEIGVISGMRQMPQIKYLRDNSDLLLIAVDANPEVRFKRALERGKAGEAADVEEFVQKEQEENSGTVQRLFDCMKEADFSIDNDASLELLLERVDGILRNKGLLG